MSFEDACKTFQITPCKVTFNVTPEVYEELTRLAQENERNLPDYMRDMVDYFIDNQPVD